MKKSAVILCAALAVAILDGVFKFLAHRYLPIITLHPNWPIAFGLHRNPGITFDIPVPLAIVLPLTVMICVALCRFAQHHWATQPLRAVSALVLVIGALGNATDRLITHATTDYLILFTRSVINLSDILIVLGALGLLYYTENTPSGGAKI